MRMLIAIAAIAASTAACQPDSDKTNPAIATDESAAQRQAEAPAMGASSFTEEQARDQITKAGYSDVTALTKAADGTWQGSAMMSGASVNVVVDYQGNVTTNASTMGTSTTSTPGMDTTTPNTTPPTTPTP